ncbi:MAG: UvrD-helicase domain-containing protein [Clostridiales bacterium]|nr:UvrD-helicase domain-containing protein [Clostridiales bacterium]
MDLSKLNEHQIKPVTDTDGQLLVVAGAGSGKTRVLTYRVAYLIRHLDVDPYNILAITFTNKAANEMKTRINTMLGEDNPVWVSTFHSMANRILRADIDKIGYDRNFSIYAEADVDKVLKRIIQNKHKEDKDGKLLSKVRWHISTAKNMGKNSAQYALDAAFSHGEDEVTEIFSAYEEELKNCNALDFDDLLVKTVELFSSCPEVLVKYGKRFKYIHIDEFQDTNKIQYLLLRMLSSYHLNIFAVGDDDQSIYGFRGADVSNMLNFKKDFPDAKIYKLERNYRSTENILNAANAVISNNKNRINKKLWTETGGGDKVLIRENSTDRDEADFVINKINEYLKSGYSLKDMAILVRQNSLTRLFEEKLNMYGYSYKLFGGFKFYERKEIKDVIAYMKLVSNPKDKEAFYRIINFPKRGIGEAVLTRLRDRAATTGRDIIDVILNIEEDDVLYGVTKARLTEFKNLLIKLMDASIKLPLFEYVNEIVRIVGFEAYYKNGENEDVERFENIAEFVNAVREFIKDNPGASAEEFLQSVSLVSDLETEENGDNIVLATIHSVKGLEFKIVFIAGLEENLFPSQRSVNEDSEVQEERRVMYVAITRAGEKLVITYAKSRFRFNDVLYSTSSRFVTEMEAGCDVCHERLADLRKNNPSGYSNFKFGSAYEGNYGGYRGTFGKAKPENSHFLVPERAAIEKMAGSNQASAFSVQEQGLSKPSYYGAGDIRSHSDAKDGDLSKYKPGVKVFHKKFGEGTIVSVTGVGGDMSASIAFAGLGIKKFNVSLAPIKIIGN